MTDLLVISLTLLLVGIPFVFQGLCVLNENHGYRKDPRYKDHPEMKGVRKGDRMLVVRFLIDRDRGKYN